MTVSVFRESPDDAPWLLWHVAETKELSLGESTTAQLELDFNVTTGDHDKRFVCRELRSGTTCTTEALTVACKAIFAPCSSGLLFMQKAVLDLPPILIVFFFSFRDLV